MSTIDWSTPANPILGGGNLLKASLAAQNDVTEWAPISGSFELMCDAGTTFTVEVYRSYSADKSDAVLVDSQDESNRGGRYDFLGTAYIQIKLAAVTGGPVLVSILR